MNITRRWMRNMGLSLALAASALAQAPPKTHLKVGDIAPDFKVPATTAAKSFQLSDYKGKSGVVVAFFPAAFTGGCTKEMTAYGTELEKFKGMGFEVIGISTDNLPSLGAWQKEVLKVDAPLGSDFATRKTAEAYGVLMKDRGMANRATFVVDKEGKITHIEEGSAAVDISGAVNACSRLAGKH